jgi:hypothetical protein
LKATSGFSDKTFGSAGKKLDAFRKFVAEDRAIAQRIVKGNLGRGTAIDLGAPRTMSVRGVMATKADR